MIILGDCYGGGGVVAQCILVTAPAHGFGIWGIWTRGLKLVNFEICHLREVYDVYPLLENIMYVSDSPPP